MILTPWELNAFNGENRRQIVQKLVENLENI